jgi:hypothetical protein
MLPLPVTGPTPDTGTAQSMVVGWRRAWVLSVSVVRNPKQERTLTMIENSHDVREAWFHCFYFGRYQTCHCHYCGQLIPTAGFGRMLEDSMWICAECFRDSAAMVYSYVQGSWM